VKASATPSLWLLAIVPLLFAAMCLPMALELIGPNPFYGVRIEATPVSDIEWYRINRVAGIAGVVAGLVGFLANLRVMRSGMTVLRKQWACLAVLVGVTLVIIATSLISA